MNRMIDGLNSERNTVGQTFAASLDEPVLIDGQPAIQRGADVVVKLVADKQSGKLTGKPGSSGPNITVSKLALQLHS